MMDRHLDATGKGEINYDYANDILLFKVKDRDYLKSIDFDDFVVDIDKEGYITGLRVFDASKLFRLSKLSLKNIKQFDFNAKIEEKVITIQFYFTSVMRNKPSIRHGQDLVREAADARINNSEVVCTVA
ncbi:DUF2283 domain-containing protein [Candidatus Woesearchaeota archaeon]|nr:DUF2283 domain-containing protein [Candidatus Woesearchaeota archaeon]